MREEGVSPYPHSHRDPHRREAVEMMGDRDNETLAETSP